MIPIHQLLSRINWDPEFGRATFTIGYYDRVEKRIIHQELADILFPADRRDCFQAMDQDGVIHTIPLHRIREVYRNGELIWQRLPALR